VSARTAAETAAATAGADAAAVATAAIGTATDEATAAAVAAEAAADAADASALAAANSAALVGAPADNAIATAINAAGSATKAALSATVAATTPPVGVVAPAQPKTVVTTFAAGHGWTASGSGLGSADLNATDNPAFGTQHARITTLATGGAILDSGVLTTPLDARGCSLRLTFRVPHYLDLLNCFVYAGTGASLADTYEFRYSNGENDPGFQYTLGGEWATITLNWADATTIGSPNRAKLDHFRISSVGNNKALMIDFNELAIVPDQNAYPKGVLTFCFDDQDTTVWSAAAPILDKYRVPATIFTIKDFVGQAGYMTLDQLKAVEREKGWEVAAHAYSTDVHTSAYTAVTPDVALKDMQQIRDWLTANGFKGRDHLAYPHGYYNKDVLKLARQVFTTARGTVRRTRHETLPPGDPYRVRCLEIFNTDTPAYVKGEIDKAVANKSWLILLFHIIRTPASALTSWTQADFADVVAYAAASGAAIRNYGDAVKEGVRKTAPQLLERVQTGIATPNHVVASSTTPATVPGMSVTFTSNSTTDIHQVTVCLDVKADGGAATMLGNLRLDGTTNAAGTLNFSAASATRTGATKKWTVTGLQPGTHTAEFQTAVAATPTTGFTVYASSTIEVVSPPAI